MSEENLESLKRLYSDWAVGDFRDESSLYDPHVVAVSPDPSPEPQYGSQAVSDYTRRFLESWEQVRFEATGYRQVGDTVVVNVHRTGIGKGSGAKLEDDVFHVWTFRGGKAIRIDVLDREAEALQAVGLERWAMSQESIDALRAFYDALNGRHTDQALLQVHPKVEVRTALDQIEAIGGSRGPIRGHNGLREWFDNTFGAFEKVTIEFNEIVEGKDGQIVAVENWRVRGGQGIEFDTVVTDVYGFRDGLIIRVDGFRDRADALEAAGLRE